jgi:hypothetical protein
VSGTSGATARSIVRATEAVIHPSYRTFKPCL